MSPLLTYTRSALARWGGITSGVGRCCVLVGMARPSLSRSTAAAGGSWWAGGWAGRVSLVPYSISAAEMLLSDLGAVLILKRTQGRCCGQSTAAPLALNPSFSCLCTLSTMPLLWGW